MENDIGCSKGIVKDLILFYFSHFLERFDDKALYKDSQHWKKVKHGQPIFVKTLAKELVSEAGKKSIGHRNETLIRAIQESHLEWLSRCTIVKLINLKQLPYVDKGFYMQGLGTIRVKSLGLENVNPDDL
ncbi:hypothetical protein VNO78_06225 [Psophocarpus tetragonolobus]|uniref:Uncharacterized protein n=1 Tax=Psophocarpus tetragonolobus TaxID=3891 RepID=A0AAN9T1P6_PSOTE